MAVLAVGAGSGPDLGVAVSQWLLAERALNSAGNGVAKPDHGTQQNDGKDKEQRINHESNLRDSLLSPMC